jgi:hypothetical protein
VTLPELIAAARGQAPPGYPEAAQLIGRDSRCPQTHEYSRPEPCAQNQLRELILTENEQYAP